MGTFTGFAYAGLLCGIQCVSCFPRSVFQLNEIGPTEYGIYIYMNSKKFHRLRVMAKRDSKAALARIEYMAGELNPMAMLYIADAIRIGSHYQPDLEKSEAWYARLLEISCDGAIPWNGANSLGTRSVR